MKRRIVVLTGGVGGAKLVAGLRDVVGDAAVTAIVNTGDDFSHFGLRISPDIDTLLYTLAGKADAKQGWGRAGETWSFMAALRELGGSDWFALGDHDLALHVLRTDRLARGEPLSAITRDFARAWGIETAILPATDDPIATIVETGQGDMEFQRYFVAERCAPVVRGVRFAGADAAARAPGVSEAIAEAEAILIAPSNPWLSVDPVLAVPGIKSALAGARAPIVAVSPLVGGTAVKGPTAKIMAELGLALTNASIAAHYAGIVGGLLIHSGDDRPTGLALAETNTLMHDGADRRRVAEAALALAETLARQAA